MIRYIDNYLKYAIVYGQFSKFQIAKFQIERLKSQKQICCLCVRTVSNFKLPGSRPQKQTLNFENWPYTIAYFTILCYAMLYYTMLCYAILCYTILYYAMLYYAMLYYTILYYTILYHTMLYYIILYYTILYYTMLYYTILYYTTQNYTTWWLRSRWGSRRSAPLRRNVMSSRVMFDVKWCKGLRLYVVIVILTCSSRAPLAADAVRQDLRANGTCWTGCSRRAARSEDTSTGSGAHELRIWNLRALGSSRSLSSHGLGFPGPQGMVEKFGRRGS